MRHTKSINISMVKMDRHPLNGKTLSLIKYLESGGMVPPIKVASLKQGGYIIKDGRHRITAFKLLDRPEIKAKYSTKPILIK